jgi:predicted PurR-regulated permease PerM
MDNVACDAANGLLRRAAVERFMFPLPLAGKVGLYVLLLLAGVVALHFAEAVVVPLLVALLLATVLGPAAVWLQKKLQIRWLLACVTVVTGLVVVNILLFGAFSAAVTRVVTRFSDDKNILSTHAKLRANLERIWPGKLDPEIFPENPEGARDLPIFQYAATAAPSIFREATLYGANWMWQVILILFTTFFVLLEGKMLVRRVVAIFGPSHEVQDHATTVLLEMAAQVRTYLVWRTIINVGLALVMYVIFSIAGLSQALTWAILLAILNYIPYFGPVLAAIPPFLDSFVTNDHPLVPFVILALYTLVIVVEGWLVVPLLMGRSMDLNATTVMLACLFWPLVWGPTGLFLAMPIMAGIKAIFTNVPELRVWADLMSSGENAEPPPMLGAGETLAPPSSGDSSNGKARDPHTDGVKLADSETRAS